LDEVTTVRVRRRIIISDCMEILLKLIRNLFFFYSTTEKICFQ